MNVGIEVLHTRLYHLCQWWWQRNKHVAPVRGIVWVIDGILHMSFACTVGVFVYKEGYLAL